MNNLFLVNETFTNGYLANILNVISLFAVLCGVFVIISKNPVVSVLFLIGLFGNVASYLILIGLGFMGLAYLVVYIGAISILFLFILMLINIRISELQSNTRNTIPLAITITIALNYPLFKLLPYDVAILSNNLNDSFFYLHINKYNPNYINNLNALDKSGEHISFVTSNMWDGNLAESGHITSIGSVLYTNYNMWLLIASLILLLAMVGVLVIVYKPYTQPSSSHSSTNLTQNSAFFKGDQKRSFHSKRSLMACSMMAPVTTIGAISLSIIGYASKRYTSSVVKELQDSNRQWYRIFNEPLSK